MSLKGYQWLVDDKVVMSFWFKDLSLYVSDKTPKEEEQKFLVWLAERNMKPNKTIYDHKEENS